MALVTGQWSRISFKPLSDPAWITVPSGSLPGTVLQAVRDGSIIQVYCIDDAGPVRFTYLNGPDVELDAAMIDTETPVSTNVQLMDDGSKWFSARNSAGHWLWWSNQTSVVSSLSSPAALAAFIT